MLTYLRDCVYISVPVDFSEFHFAEFQIAETLLIHVLQTVAAPDHKIRQCIQR